MFFIHISLRYTICVTPEVGDLRTMLNYVRCFVVQANNLQENEMLLLFLTRL